MSFRSLPAASLPQGSLEVGSHTEYLELRGFKSSTWTVKFSGVVMYQAWWGSWPA